MFACISCKNQISEGAPYSYPPTCKHNTHSLRNPNPNQRTNSSALLVFSVTNFIAVLHYATTSQPLRINISQCYGFLRRMNITMTLLFSLFVLITFRSLFIKRNKQKEERKNCRSSCRLPSP